MSMCHIHVVVVSLIVLKGHGPVDGAVSTNDITKNPARTRIGPFISTVPGLVVPARLICGIQSN